MAHNRIGIREFVELTVRTGDLNPVTSNSNNMDRKQDANR